MNRLRRRGTAVVTVLALTIELAVTAASPASATDSGLNCGGVMPTKSTGGTYTCAFDDEFSDKTLDASKWGVQETATSGYRSGQECFLDTPKTVSVSDGTLNLSVIKTPTPFTCADPDGNYTSSYPSGMVTTAGKYTQTYGRFEVRAALPAASIKGLQESFWLWPANSSKYGSKWPASGEMDIAEIYSRFSDRAVPYIHYNSAKSDPNVTNTNCLIKDVSAFHTYVLEWTATTITVSYDGTTCLMDTWHPVSSMPASAPFDQPFELSLTQALGIGNNEFTTSTPLPATTRIDYVRIWK